MKSALEDIIIKTARKPDDKGWISLNETPDGKRLIFVNTLSKTLKKFAASLDALVIYDLDKKDDKVVPVIEAFTKLSKTGIVNIIFLYSKTPVDLKSIDSFSNLSAEFIKKPVSRDMLEFTIRRMRSTRTSITGGPQVRDRIVADPGGNKKYYHDDHLAKNYRVLIGTLSKQLVSEITQNIELRYRSGTWGSKEKDNRSLISSLLEVIPDPVFFKNQNGQYLGCNEAYELFVNRPKEEITGKTLYDFLDAEQAKYFTDKENVVLETGTPVVSEETVKFPDRKHNILQIQNRYVFMDGNEKHKGIIGLLIDQTEKIRTDQMRSVQRDIEYFSWLQGGLKSSLDYILNKLTEVYWIDSGGVYLLDEKGELLHLISHEGLSDEFVKLTSRYELSSQQVKLMEKKEAIYFSSKEIREAGLAEVLNEGLNYLAALPLIHENQLIGSLNLASREDVKISENDKLYLEFTASRLGSMIAFLKANDELKQSWKVLDAKVKGRTKELREINQKLKREIAISRKAKNDLAISENLYRSIFTNARDGIVLYDAKTMSLIDLNPKAYEDLEYTREEFMQLTPADFTIYESESQRKEILDELFSKRNTVYNVRHKTKSGKIRFSIINASLVEIGEKEYILGIVHDMTKLKLTESELDRTINAIQELTRKITIGIFRLNSKGIPVFMNPYARQLMGIGLSDRIEDVDLQRFGLKKFRMLRLLASLGIFGNLKNQEILITRPDGTNFIGNINLNTYIDGQDGDADWFIDGTIDDNTALRKTQDELELANKQVKDINRMLEQRIEEAIEEHIKQQSLLLQKSKLESLGELAAGITHEINQPVGIISLALENLQARFDAGTATPDYFRYKFGIITEHMNRIRKIIENIRIFSRDQSNQSLEKVFLNRIVMKATSLMKVQFQEYNISLELDLQDNNEFTVGSRVKTEQVLYNLLSNARYALEEREILEKDPEYKKTIRISTGVTNDKKLFLEVFDNGAGIQEENMAKIFDPFFSTKSEFKGTGLGLSVVYGIIHDMKGSILVKSEVNNYTKFRITLPLYPEKD